MTVEEVEDEEAALAAGDSAVVAFGWRWRGTDLGGPKSDLGVDADTTARATGC